MTTTEVGTVPVRRGLERRRRWWAGVAWVLLLAHLVAVAAVLLTGQRPAPLGELRERLESGEVGSVVLRGGLPPGSTGFSVVEVSWRDGLFERVTEVKEQRSRSDRAPRTDRAWSSTLVDSGVPVVRGSLEQDLLARQPGLEVIRADPESGAHAAVLGLRVNGPLAPALLGLVLADLLLLALGPEPVRATRWGWAWLLFSPAGLIVGVALLLLGGHLRLVPRPAPGSRRLTGGWAFLLFLVLVQVLGSDV
ncbi:hypothetical protein [Nocardioides sp. AX2bis]|uniref:hypothetical protein n=1 Tax=Nocardioides sp. AX2bis TaxID=2653157 RepID=UPI0012F3E632|nr:hypothetical protein [Nocardioides sp. AX2bis]VXB39596.1 conserved membrane hypothetical protein [Nocardioides sp. AX2bis]